MPAVQPDVHRRRSPRRRLSLPAAQDALRLSAPRSPRPARALVPRRQHAQRERGGRGGGRRRVQLCLHQLLARSVARDPDALARGLDVERKYERERKSAFPARIDDPLPTPGELPTQVPLDPGRVHPAPLQHALGLPPSQSRGAVLAPLVPRSSRIRERLRLGQRVPSPSTPRAALSIHFDSVVRSRHLALRGIRDPLFLPPHPRRPPLAASRKTCRRFTPSRRRTRLPPPRRPAHAGVSPGGARGSRGGCARGAGGMCGG